MFEILLLLAGAAFSGHEVAATVDASQPPPAVQSVVAEAPVADGTAVTAANPIMSKPVVSKPVASTPVVSAPPVASAPTVRVADDASPAETDADVKAAVDRVSDFYDTTPPTPAARHPSTPAATAPVRSAAKQAGAKESAAQREPLGPHLIRSTEKYMSEGRPVVIEIMRPDDDARRPAVLILHGASGIGDGAFYRGAAEIFAERGYVTFIPHYLAALRAAPVKTAAAHGKRTSSRPRAVRPPEGSIRAGFSRQEQILRDAVDYMARDQYVDSSRIGVFGLSLGGFHALTLSSTDGRIAAVVDMSGALRGNVVPDSNHIAPTLELHGAHDPIVPVARARELSATLDKLGVPHELKIYPNQGHFLRGKAQEDALQRSAAFFGTYLTPSETSHAERSSGSIE